MAEHYDLKKEPKSNLENDKTIIKNYLVSKGVAEERLVFSAVNFREKTRVYSPKGDFMGEEFVGYELTQSVQIESNEVEKLKKSQRLPNCLTKE